MMSRYPGQGAYDCREGNLLQPIRSTTQMLVVTGHQYGISVVIS